jgi:hypothetical protein
MTEEDARNNTVFLDRLLGSDTGWDGDQGQCWWVYNFEPAPGVELPKCDCLNINEEIGMFEITNVDGTVTQRFDMLQVLNSLSKLTPL